MISRLQHLQLAQLHLSTHVASTKSVAPNQSRFRAPGFKYFLHIPLRPCSGFKAKHCNCYYFSFLFLFFFFRRRIDLLSTGVLNLLKVVDNTRIGYCKVKEVAQFFSLSLKPYVLCVWLAKGGRKRLKAARIQLIIHSIRHGTNLTSIELDKFSNFQTMS